jgi:hypothetical protein
MIPVALRQIGPRAKRCGSKVCLLSTKQLQEQLYNLEERNSPSHNSTSPLRPARHQSSKHTKLQRIASHVLDMAPTRSKKRKSTESTSSVEVQGFPAPPQIVAAKTRSPARTPPSRSPIKKVRMGITVGQKQALIDNLQLESMCIYAATYTSRTMLIQ